jgi:hypothetical protein
VCSNNPLEWTRESSTVKANSMSHKSLALLATLLFATLGVAVESPASTYEGVYFYNFENAHFTPKGETKCWALKGDMSSAELPGKNGSAPWGTATVVLRGVLSQPGRFGNLGACTRLFTVLEVVEVRDRTQR